MATQQVYDREIITLLHTTNILSKVVSVIIVGGGPAGCATALALQRIDPHRSVLLIDDADPAAFKVMRGCEPFSSFCCLNTGL